MRRNAEKTPPDTPCPVIGIGASAGGIEALQRFFPAVEPDCGMSFVVVQHLSPEHKSILADLIARASRLPVTQIKDETKVEPNHVYVIPPNASLTLADGRLHLAKPTVSHRHRTPIDGFLASLAEAQGENAACVILSGTGSDGTLGLRAIKQRGGLTIAQAEAEYDGMMRSAVATGLVDLVLRAEEMPAKLAEHFGHLAKMGERKGPDGVAQETTDYLAQICALLRTRTGHDFSDYKDKTVARRVQRRMHVLQIDEVPTFVERLRKDPREADLLFQDLLIGVTNFFRDREAFEALERQVIPKLFEGKGPDDTVRVWVPGCSTGEEAYSIAILLREHMPRVEGAPKLQIFATDIDENALETARIGRYPATIAHDMSPKRLTRYFLREDGTYRIASELRESCLFSLHNLLRDPPFSRLDLISCRNLLIYLNADLQNRVIPLLHYALRGDGYLFLGSSENVTRHSRLFANVDKANRIFQRRPQEARRLPEFPLTAARASPPRPGRSVPVIPPERSLQDLAERQILDRYAPAYVVVTAAGEVLHTSGRTGKYLELPAGTPDINLFGMARSGLRMDLRSAVHKAASTGQATIRNGITIGTNGGRQTLNLIVQPLRTGDLEDALFLVAFQDVGGVWAESELESAESATDVEGATRHLEAELQATKERLQTTTEELESSNEELKSANEELSSMNEELQSANEELETSKEELQSINEELQTVNTELNARVEELSRANSDISNLLESTQIATVFLDRDLHVMSFTPAAKDLFRLVESDEGRPLSHVRPRFSLETLQDDAERVLRTLGTIERQVDATDSGARYAMRILPYRTAEDVIAGVVITFTDITKVTEAEARISALSHDLRNRVADLETLLDLVPVGIFIVEDGAHQQVRTNRYGARLLGDEEEGRRGLPQVLARYRLLERGRELSAEEHPLQRAAKSGETVPGFEGRLERADGSQVDVMISSAPLFDEDGRPRGAIAAMVDISHRIWAAAQQDILLGELEHRVKNILATVTSLATRMVRASDSLDGFAAAFLPRLQAMGRTHNLLTEHHWEGTGLRSLIKAALEPFASNDQANIALSGPKVLLKPNAASSLGMVFHELATNAAKYGSLSTVGGGIDVSWQISGDAGNRRVALTWDERDGPAVEKPMTKGFGTSFILRCVEYELDGTADLAYGSNGLHCAIAFPLSEPGGRAERQESPQTPKAAD
ncbi:MAG TPA: chemotaxis protein CheB [Alphaproteobacteria bacterium]|nr:chemotaxis protein CheB [Alphaproteobacteria bacterium]